jgi:hypothetical protein
VWVNLFIGSNTTLKVGKNEVPLTMETNYPWEGNVKLTVQPKSKTKFAMHVRIPGWAQGQVVPGDLYLFEDKTPAAFTINVNGKPAQYKIEKGYALIDREWKKGDVVDVNIPMEVKRVKSRPELKQDEERVALQRGPIVYCVEGADNSDKAWNILLPDKTSFTTSFQKDLLGGVQTIQFQAPTIQLGSDGKSVSTEMKTITAIPYYSWCNRGQNQMQVWLPQKIKDIKINY